MKKLLFYSIAIAATFGLASCGNKEKAETVEVQEIDLTQVEATEQELREALANQDSLLNLLNEISADMDNIRQIEGLMSSVQGESPSVRQQLRDDMKRIQATLQQRREQLAQLEKKLASADANNAVLTKTNATLQKTIDNLKAQIEQQEKQIEEYRVEIEQKNTTIAEQGEKIEKQQGEIQDLNTTVSQVTEAKEQAEEQNVKLTDQINTCYYVIGTSKELNDKGIIKSGFLRKTKILPGDVDKQYFTQADKRTLLEINCHSKKAEVKTNQPESSYQFTEEANGNKILVIKDPKEFWQKSNFLVIQVK